MQLFNGTRKVLNKNIKNAWFKSVNGAECNDKPLFALEIDEPLWYLPNYGYSEQKNEKKCPPI